jgi:hypothetical protein
MRRTDLNEPVFLQLRKAKLNDLNA